MKKRPFRRLIAAFLTMALFVTLLPNIPGGVAEAAPESNVEEISNFKELYDAIVLSQMTDEAAARHYVLISDIEITPDNLETVKKDENRLSFGSEEEGIPFTGTFDGQGHTITGLKYEEIATDPVPDTGLFSYTKGATIKNLTIKNARIEADMRAGIVVGYAEDTILQNVTVEESELAVRAADNVLLIGTDLGVRGGGIAGEMKNSVAYDCEVNNCSLITNNTSAVQALAGKDLYQGGIVGVADNSVIEYCRVIGDDPWNPDAVAGIGDDSTTARNTYARIYYDVAVGAIGGNTLYVGGIAGDIKNGTQIIDSFSTAELNFYCATYVSVLGVNVGHIGGITGGIGTDDCKITRCHYAGQASSYQYNPVAVIPIIQHDVNISGVADYFRETYLHNTTIQGNVYGAFFMDSLNPDVDMDSLRDLTGSSITSNGNYGPWSNDLYGSRSAWESFGFDFTGTVERTTVGADALGAHYNKWVMDRELGIPVHGNSVAATFDFPGAGAVTIAPTELVGSAVSTSDPYTFAVQGNKASEKAITLTYTPIDAVNYRLDGWWRIPDITEPSVAQDHSYFEGLYEQYGTLTGVPIYGNAEQTQEVHNPVDESEAVEEKYTYTPTNEESKVTAWEDNDLFVARVEALVTFHDCQGNLVNTAGARQNDPTDDDWYYYEETLPLVTPGNAPEAGENAGEYTLIGWTTNGGSSENLDALIGIAADKLDTLKANGDFYETGDLITKPLTLYPIYTNYVTNLITEFEGYNYDTDGGNHEGEAGYTERATRPEVGTTRGTYDPTTGEIKLHVELYDDPEPKEVADGYEFLGWYVYSDDPNSDIQADYCVSRDMDATLTGYDMSKEQVFVARFKYRVDYYEWYQRASGNESESKYANSSVYKSVWYQFGDEFQAIPGLNFFHETFQYWGESKDHNSDASFSGEIYAPKNVYSVNEQDNGDVYRIDVLNDFPGAGKIVITYGIGDFQPDFNVTTNDEYNFIGWTWESAKQVIGSLFNKKEAGKSTDVNGGTIDTRANNTYTFFGHFTANVDFFKPDAIENGNTTTVTRRYAEQLYDNLPVDETTGKYGTPIADGDEEYIYPYFINNTEKTTLITHTAADIPTDDEMKMDGYIFLGWVNINDIDEEEKAYIWGDDFRSTTDYITYSPEKAEPYLLSYEDLKSVYVTETMDFWPVYVKYEYTFTTNLEKMGFTGTDTINVPSRPAEKVDAAVEGENGYSKTITFTVDNTTKVLKDSEDKTTYQVTSVECVNLATNERETITPNTDGSYSYKVTAGTPYEFIANYNPVPVIYHIRIGDLEKPATEAVTRNINDRLGVSPNPEFDADTVGDAVFQGWTTERPANGASFHTISSGGEMPAFVSPDTIVTQPMELWPVYQQIGISVDSNIDTQLNSATIDLDTIRNVKVVNPAQASASLWAEDSVEVGGKVYGFVGWYTGYQNDTSTGELVSENPQTTISGNDIFSVTIYTAVYKEAKEVRYHNTAGDVIYRAYVTEDDRTFVTEQEIPGEDGTMNKVTVPEDVEAFTKIQEKGNIPANEQFVEWQWVKADGSAPVRWDDFCNETIIGSMDLYPVTNAITVQDTNQDVLNPYKEASTDADGNSTEATGDVMVSIGQETGTDGEPTGDSIVTVLLRSNYNQPYVDVILSEKAYNGTDTPTEDIKSDEKVSLYLAGDETLNNVSLYDTEKTAQSAHTGMNKIHAHFDLYGELKLTKALTDDTTAENGEVFMFNVKLGDGAIQKIPVNAGDTVTIDNIPFGITCTVSEDTGWSWRYEVSWGGDDAITKDGFTPSSYTPDKAVTATNSKTNDKWMDSSAYVSNQFGKDENGNSTITQIIPGETTGEETGKK